MDWLRIVRHLATPPWRVSRVLPEPAMQAVTAAIRASETTHAGQIRVAVECALDLGPLLSGQRARDRAVELFSRLGVWDTEHNNGVLIYLLLADRDMEIVADRGIHARVGTAGWETICRAMEAEFREGRFEQGLLGGIEAVSQQLRTHFPGAGSGELPDRPVLL
ncbi:MAG: TPM domain-containing protein [Gammaproteobacteria bacterium]